MSTLATPMPIFAALGTFSAAEQQWFMQHLQWVDVKASECILQKGEIFDAVFFLERGACYQCRTEDGNETIVDLHVQGEWIFDQQSLLCQEPSSIVLRAFQPSRMARLGLNQIHTLMNLAPAFLQLGRLFNQGHERKRMYDEMMDPSEKYDYLMRTRPLLTTTFPVKMVASYLKLAPETLSRVRAKYRIS